jgi:hypothetical protein
LRDAQSQTTLLGKYALQLGEGQIGTMFERTQQAGLGRRVDAAQRSMPLLDPILLSALPLLSENLLHPAQADAKHLCKRTLRAFARTVRRQYLASQIVIVGSRHLLRGDRLSCLIVTLNML